MYDDEEEKREIDILHDTVFDDEMKNNDNNDENSGDNFNCDANLLRNDGQSNDDDYIYSDENNSLTKAPLQFAKNNFVYDYATVYNDINSAAITNVQNNIPEMQLTPLLMDEYQRIFDKPLPQVYGASNYDEIRDWVEKKGDRSKGFIKIFNPLMVYDKYHKCKLQSPSSFFSFIKFKTNEIDEKGGNQGVKEKIKPFYPVWWSATSTNTKQSMAWIPPPIPPEQEAKISNIFNTFDLEQYHSIATSEIIPLPRCRSRYPNILIHFFVEIVCNGVPGAVTYWQAFLYHLIFFPAVNPQIINLLYSKAEGTGKNSWCSIIEALIGAVYFQEISGVDFLNSTTGFTGSTEYCVTVVNEIGPSMLRQIHIEAIKARVTNALIRCNQKFEKMRFQINVARIIITLNHKTLIGVGRRFAIWPFNESKTQDTKYFTKLRKAISDTKQIKIFFNWIMQHLPDQIINDLNNSKFSFRKFYSKIPQNYIQKQLDFENCGFYIKFMALLFGKMLTKEELLEPSSSEKITNCKIVMTPLMLVQASTRFWLAETGNTNIANAPNVNFVIGELKNIRGGYDGSTSFVVYKRRQDKRCLFLDYKIFYDWCMRQKHTLLGTVSEVHEWYMQRIRLEYSWLPRSQCPVTDSIMH